MDDAVAGGAVVLPLEGTLDLHSFKPGEVKAVVAEYLVACRSHGILELRIIHGKGTGSLRRQVHAVLGRTSEVSRFALAPETAGGWGATLVTLRPLTK